MVQPLDSRLKKVKDISSVAILENGTPVLIVDVEDMVRTIDALITGNRLRRIGTGFGMANRIIQSRRWSPCFPTASGITWAEAC